MSKNEPIYYIQYNCWYDSKILYISKDSGFYHTSYNVIDAFWSTKKLQKGFILMEEYPEDQNVSTIRSEFFKIDDIKTIAVKSTNLLITLNGESPSKESGILIEGTMGLLNKINEALIYIKDF